MTCRRCRELEEIIELQRQQLADADAALLRIDSDTRALGRAVREYVETPEQNGPATELRRLHPSAVSTGDEVGVHPPARLRLVTNNDNETNLGG